MKKRMLSFLLAVCMMLSLTCTLSVRAYAAEPTLNPKGYNMTVNVGSGSTLRFCSTVSTADAYELGSIPNGTSVYVYGITVSRYENRTWAKISYNSRDGWVNYAWLYDAGNPKVTISYNANGGYGAPSDHTAAIVHGSASYTLSSVMPTRSGYTFKGWRLENNTAYGIDSPGQHIQIALDSSCTLTYYAQWELTPPVIEVKPMTPVQSYYAEIEYYDLNGGRGLPTSQSVEIENGCANFRISSSKPVRSGYEFTGWYCDYDGQMYSAGEYAAIYTGSSSTTIEFYARWKSSSSAGLHNFRETRTYRNNFRDVSTSAWYYENVRKAYNYGLMQGVSSDRFGVAGNITIAEAVTMACRLHSIYYTGSENFEQTGSVWYQAYLDYAERNGILTRSYSSYTRAATRAEFAEILSAAFPDEALAEKNSIEDGVIPDVSSGTRGYSAIYRLYRAGVLAGSDQYGTFNPSSTILRVEAAAIVTRMAVPSLRQTVNLSVKGVLLGDLTPVSSNKIKFESSANCMQDNYGNIYDNYYRLDSDSGFFVHDTNEAVYNVDRQYKKLSGKAVISAKDKNVDLCGWVKIYGDGTLIFDSQQMSRGARPIGFSLDISAYRQIRIEEYQDYRKLDSTTFVWCAPYLVDLCLS